jgi:hypothetical protein
MMDCGAEAILSRHLAYYHASETDRGELRDMDPAEIARHTRLPAAQVERLLKRLNVVRDAVWENRGPNVQRCFQVGRGG